MTVVASSREPKKRWHGGCGDGMMSVSWLVEAVSYNGLRTEYVYEYSMV